MADLTTETITEWGGEPAAPSVLGADGDQVLLVENGRMLERSIDGGGARVLKIKDVTSFGHTMIPSPDGRWLAYAARHPLKMGKARDLHVLDRETGTDAVIQESMTLFGGFWID